MNKVARLNVINSGAALAQIDEADERSPNHVRKIPGTLSARPPVEEGRGPQKQSKGKEQQNDVAALPTVRPIVHTLIPGSCLLHNYNAFQATSQGSMADLEVT